MSESSKMQETFCWDLNCLLVKGAVCLELCPLSFARWLVLCAGQTKLPVTFSLSPRDTVECHHIHRLPQLSACKRHTAAWSRVGYPAQRKFIYRVATSLGYHLITEVCQELNNSCKFLLSFLNVCYQRRKKQQLVGLKHLDELHLLDNN